MSWAVSTGSVPDVVAVSVMEISPLGAALYNEFGMAEQ